MLCSDTMPLYLLRDGLVLSYFYLFANLVNFDDFFIRAFVGVRTTVKVFGNGLEVFLEFYASGVQLVVVRGRNK